MAEMNHNPGASNEFNDRRLERVQSLSMQMQYQLGLANRNTTRQIRRDGEYGFFNLLQSAPCLEQTSTGGSNALMTSSLLSRADTPTGPVDKQDKLKTLPVTPEAFWDLDSSSPHSHSQDIYQNEFDMTKRSKKAAKAAARRQMALPGKPDEAPVGTKDKQELDNNSNPTDGDSVDHQRQQENYPTFMVNGKDIQKELPNDIKRKQNSIDITKRDSVPVSLGPSNTQNTTNHGINNGNKHITNDKPLAPPETEGEVIKVTPDIFTLIEDMSIFYKWPLIKFEQLDRNSLLAFIHIYANKEMPPSGTSDAIILKIFVEKVYNQNYWISWTREAILYCINDKFKKFMGPDTVRQIMKAADDYQFLAYLAPKFKEKSDARQARLEAARAKAAKEQSEKANKGLVSGEQLAGKGKSKGKGKAVTQKSSSHGVQKPEHPLVDAFADLSVEDHAAGELSGEPLAFNAFDDCLDLFLSALVGLQKKI